MDNARSNVVPAVLAAALLVAAAQPAGALEMLPNGKLDTGLASWAGCCGSTGTLAFDATRDAGRSPFSGSAVLTHTGTGGQESYLFMSHCVSGPEVQGGAAFFFGAKVRFRELEPSTGIAFLAAEFRPDAACQSANLGGVVDEVSSGDARRGAWIRLKAGSPSAGVVLPAGTNSIRVGIVISRDTGTKMSVNVDDVFAAPVGTPVCDGFPATHVGTSSNDLIAGTSASDVIVGLGGKDWIDGGGGNDRICGGPGADVLYGGYGDDRLFGQGGADDLYGAHDADLLEGGGGNDDLYGGDGKDQLVGGSGIDACDGGNGNTDTAKGCETVLAVP